MLCNKCKANTASFFYTQNINGKETSVALCNACAESSGLAINTVSPLFGSFFGSAAKNSRSIKNEGKKCSLCTLTFTDILSMGKVGCPECYNTFKAELYDTIRSIHGTAKHTGLTPTGKSSVADKPPVAEKDSEEDTLRARLNEAISAENYEEAALLRDKIKALKGEK